MTADEKMSDAEKELRLNHAWRYFELHAGQRISLIRYYIVFFSLYISGCVYLLIQADHGNASIDDVVRPFSCVFILMTIIFYLLDCRNRKLIHLAEDSLRVQENELNWKSPHNIFEIEKDQSEKKNYLRHTDCFAALYVLSIAVALIFIFYMR